MNSLFSIYMVILLSVSFVKSYIHSKFDDTILKRVKRTIAFPRGSSFGYVAAVAVPLDLAEKHVYLSFLFEANYGLPINNTHKDFIDKWNPDDFLPANSSRRNSIEKRNVDRSLYTRSNFFESISAYFDRFALNGTACLLKTICEISQSDMAQFNGVFGSILHTLFTPSSSQDEGLPAEFRNAEGLGDQQHCDQYFNMCPVNILDMISSIYHD